MNKNNLLSLLLATTAVVPSTAQTGYPFAQVPFTQVSIDHDSFWGQRLEAVRSVTIPLAFSKCQSERRYKNFEMAAYTLQHPNHAGLQTEDWDVARFMGFPFDDTDVYKTIEGASYILQTYPDKQLTAYLDSVLDIVAAAQEPDGYLYTARTINPEKPQRWSGNKRWTEEEVLSHELYNLGHMVDAACAHYQATGSKKFLNIAQRYADCVIREVGAASGQARVVPGHQIAEMALARLYVITGEKKYLDEAKFFLDERGKTKIHDIYTQSDKPIADQTEAWGHAVRAGYMYAGIADVAALTNDSLYIKIIDRIYDNIVGRKYYLTGSVGARHHGEAFGDDYELPNLTAYNETCAAISMVYLFQRMFLLHGQSKFIDCLERTLYNGVISGMSVDGGRFFYPNPLSSDGKYAFNSDNTTTRQPWFGCACCPSNLSRFIPSVPGYFYATKEQTVYVNLFGSNTSTINVGGKTLTLQQTTEYPWNGDIALKVLANKAGTMTLKIRIPGWVKGEVVPSDLYVFDDDCHDSWTITLNGKPANAELTADGYATLTGKLKKGDLLRIHFDMAPRTVIANEKVKDDNGKMAVERGPIVYCAEAPDNTSFDLRYIILSRKPHFTEDANKQIINTEGNGNAFNVYGLTIDNAQLIDVSTDGTVNTRNVSLNLIPYYAWNHRGATVMSVWLAKELEGIGKE